MNRLFWKLFLWFLFTIVMTAGLSFVAADYLAGQHEISAHHLKRIEVMADRAEAVLEREGEPGLRHWLRQTRRRLPFPVLAVRTAPDGDWHELGGRPAPPEVRRHMGIPRSVSELVQSRQAEHRLVSMPLAGPSGLYLVTMLPQRPLWMLFRHRYLAPGIALAVSLAACLLLAWGIARPVRRLRQAADSLAAGDLAARADVGRRRDEIGLLADDFNRMASRIEAGMQAQRQLLSDVSHELRSPLARLRVASGLVRRKMPADVAVGELARIDQEVGRLDAMLEDVLALSRLENEGAAAERQPVNVDALLAEVVADANFEYRAEQKCAEVIAAAGCRVMGDALLLRSAVDNVVRNAMKYTATESVVEAGTRAEREALILWVRDHGPGVPESALPRLFDVFYRVDVARDRDSGGHGLGLAIAARSCRLCRGTIRAENVAGGGLRVTMTLPLPATAKG